MIIQEAHETDLSFLSMLENFYWRDRSAVKVVFNAYFQNKNSNHHLQIFSRGLLYLNNNIFTWNLTVGTHYTFSPY